jgi:transcriptional regulator with XRE-family HTH domain
VTALAFRNVDASPSDPVAEWPHEAIQTALERGGLADWRRLGAAIREDPWGPVARRVEATLSHSRPYGVAGAFDRAIARARSAVEREERTAVAAEITRLVEKSGVSRAEFASRVGTSTSRLSTYVSGKVTPSAAMLLRMRRAARLLISGPLERAHDPLHLRASFQRSPEERLRLAISWNRLAGRLAEEGRRARGV